MTIARVVTFEDVDADRMTGLQHRMEEGDQPEGMPPVDVVVPHDTESGRALVLQLFVDDDNHRRGEEVFAALPAGDTPGTRP